MDLITGANAVKAAKAVKGTAELANKNSGFFGKLRPYFGLEKKAVDIYIEDIEKSDMPADTKAYLIMNTKKHFKELKNQQAIADIAVESAKEGTDFSNSSNVDEEWLDRFMDSAKFVSSEEMQLIWGKVLAGEFENPGSTPPNMRRILSEFTPELAQAFSKICSMKIDVFPLDNNEDIKKSFSNILIPNKNEVKVEIKNELITIGVISNSTFVDFSKAFIESESVLIRIENELILVNQSRAGFPPFRNVELTFAGKTLQNIIEPIEIEGYYNMIKKYMTIHEIEFTENHDYILEYEGDKPIVKRKSEQQ